MAVVHRYPKADVDPAPLYVDDGDALKRPGFDAPSVMCERPVGRHGRVPGNRLLLRLVAGGRDGA
jgi:hypothetical protein